MFTSSFFPSIKSVNDPGRQTKFMREISKIYTALAETRFAWVLRSLENTPLFSV